MKIISTSVCNDCTALTHLGIIQNGLELHVKKFYYLFLRTLSADPDLNHSI